jgi:hypothetical protein
MGAEILIVNGQGREIRRVPDVLACLLPARMPLPVKVLLLPIVVVLVCHPILLLLTAGGISAFSGYRVGCRWGALFCSWLCWSAPAGLLISLNTVLLCAVSSQFLMIGHQKYFPATARQLHELVPAGTLDWTAGGEQQVRDAVNHHLRQWAEVTIGPRARTQRLLQSREWLMGTASLGAETIERLRLADEGWKSGDYRNSRLLYGSVLPLLEDEIRCFCASGSVLERLKQLSEAELESKSRATAALD